LSGFGGGGEIGSLIAFGAKKLYAHEANALAIAASRERFRNYKNVIFVDEEEALKATADIAISRHVIEYIDIDGQAQYINNLIGIVGDGGCVARDFPNGEHPVDPHTGVMFFHLLTKGVRADIIKYFDRTRSIDVALQQKLLGIHNIAMPKINCIDDVLPKSFGCESSCYS
jgi:hypothetical protein